MVLPLVTPIGANFIKDFPSQNTINCDLIDAYAAPCLTSHSLQTYTPIITGTTTDPILGVAGLIRGYFYEIFDQIFTWGEFRFGTSGATIGVGTYLITLPFEAKSIIGANVNLGSSPVIGSGYIHDNDLGANRCPVTVHLRTSTQMAFANKMDSGVGRIVSNNIPMNWAVSDGLSWCARYQRLP